MSAGTPRLEELFVKALAIPAGEEREKFIAEKCSGNAELQQQIERLLQAAADAGSFMELPKSEVSPTAVLAPHEQLGTQIGPYKLLQEIGEGGMGVVYMAEQHAPVKRRVALKLVKPGMDSRQVVARFEAERQALAMMDHPNIARVLDCGTTEQGRPYFVMELVKGVPITRYCDENHLTPRERLELFIPICQAIQHAHQKGIIHRDIKPSNILVAEYDQKPVPKIIDFGVAKALNTQLTDLTMFTQLGQVVGTLEYMSPEQSRVNQLDVDTRSDIYSLGVLLYELLTGSTPFDRKRFREAAFDEMLRIIREEEPPRPSTRLSTIDMLPSIAANRKTEPKKLSSLLRGELDWIVMKALEKDRARRYETATSFAADIHRYLNDEAVSACPPSAAYKFQKFARRNKVAIATVSLITIALILGVIGTGWQAWRATKAEWKAKGLYAEADSARKTAIDEKRLADIARGETEKQRALLATNIDQAFKALDNVYLQVAESQLQEGEALDEKSRQFLENALPFYETFAQQQSDTPMARLALAKATLRVGVIQQKLMQWTSAEAVFRRSIERWESLLETTPTSPEYRLGRAESTYQLARNLRTQQELAEAESLYDQTILAFEALSEDFPLNHSFGVALAAAIRDRGTVYLYQLRTDLAEQELRRSSALFEKLLDQNSRDARVLIQAAENMQQLGLLLHGRGNSAEAEQLLIQSQNTLRQVPGELEKTTDSSELFTNRAEDAFQFGSFLRNSYRVERALPFYQGAVDQYLILIRNSPANPALRTKYINASRDLAIALRDMGKHAQALAILEAAQATAFALTNFWPENSDYRLRLATIEYELGNVLRLIGRIEESRLHLDRAIGLLEATDSSESPHRWCNEATYAYWYAADLARFRRDFDESERLIRKAIAAREQARKLPEVNFWDFQLGASVMTTLGYWLFEVDRPDEALVVARQAHEMATEGYQRFGEIGGIALRESAACLGFCLLQSQKTTELNALTRQELASQSLLAFAMRLQQSREVEAANASIKRYGHLIEEMVKKRPAEVTGKFVLFNRLLADHKWLLENKVYDACVRLGDAMLPLSEELRQLEPGNVSYRVAEAEFRQTRGHALQSIGRIQDAIPEFRNARDVWEQLVQNDATETWNDRVALADEKLAIVFLENKQFAEAKLYCQQAIAGFHAAAQREATSHEFRIREAASYQALRRVFENMGQENEALNAARTAYEIERGARQSATLEQWIERRLIAFQLGTKLGRASPTDLLELIQQEQDPHSLVGFANALHVKGDSIQATDVLERAIHGFQTFGATLDNDLFTRGRLCRAIAAHWHWLHPYKSDKWAAGSKNLREKMGPTIADWLVRDPNNIDLRHPLSDVHNRRGIEFRDAGLPLEAFEEFSRVLEFHPQHPWARMDVAMYKASIGDKAEALRELRSTQGASDVDVSFLDLRGRNYLQLGAYDEAEADAQHIIDLNPLSTTGFVLQGKALARQGKVDEALIAFRRALELAPKNPRVQAGHLATLVYVGRWSEQALNECLDVSDSPEQLMVFFGLELMRAGLLEPMQIAVRRSAEYGEGTESLMYFNLGCGYAVQGDNDRAFAALRRAMELGEGRSDGMAKDADLVSLRNDPRFAELLAQLKWSEAFQAGRQKLVAGAFADAIADFSQAIELNPNFPVLYQWRGSAYRKNGQTAEAAADYERYLGFYQQAVEAEPENWVAWQRQAKALANVERWEDAIQSVHRASAQAPDRPVLWRIHADCLLAKNQWVEADAELTRLLAYRADDWQSHYQRALVRLALDDVHGYSAACAEMLSALQGTQDPQAANFAAWTCSLSPWAVDNWTTPLALAHLACHAQPNSLEYQKTLGFVMLRAGKVDEAIRILDEVNSKLENDSQAGLTGGVYTWFGLALAHHAAAPSEQASLWYQRASAESQQLLTGAKNDAEPITWNRRLTIELLQREAKASLAPDALGEPAGAKQDEQR